MRRFGIHGNSDYLQISETRSPDYFRFTNQNVLQEINTGKCVFRRSDQYLVLTFNCNGTTSTKWSYDSRAKYLKVVPVDRNLCFSPWGFSVTEVTPGLSYCNAWNEIVLKPGWYYEKVE